MAVEVLSRIGLWRVEVARGEKKREKVFGIYSLQFSILHSPGSLQYHTTK